MFEPIRRSQSTVDACERALRRAVLRGELEVGDRLPPERELARSFDVTRPTIRAALGRLSASGLLAVRQGSGYTVRDYRRSWGVGMLEGLAEVAREKGRIAEIASDLLAIRRELARVLIAKLRDVPASSLDGAEDAISELERAVDRGASPRELAPLDLDVIAAFVDATGSAVLALCINPILGVLAELPELADAVYAEPKTNVAAYRFVLANLRCGKGDVSKLLELLVERDEATIKHLRRTKGRRKTTR